MWRIGSAWLAAMAVLAAPALADVSACTQPVENGYWDAAIVACTRVLASADLTAAERGEALTMESVAYANKEDAARALEALNEAVKLLPDDARPYRVRGQVLAGMGNLDQAIDDYDTALRLEPNAEADYLRRGLACYGIQDYTRAVGDM